MGTRNLTAVVKDGDFKVAQYGQWDGYPSGQGKTALEFLHTVDMDAFRAAIDRCRFLTDDEEEACYGTLEEELSALAEHLAHNDAGRKAIAASRREAGSLTHLSRDVCADILNVIVDRPDVYIPLVDGRSFAGDSLFCEWAYVIDLDQEVFEVYHGFNEGPTPPSSRFPSGANWLVKAPGFEPVVMVASWPLDALPTVEDFLAFFETETEA